MIGKTLGVKDMRRVVKHMGELDKPWNCPHGRPTMRHLCDVDQIETWKEDMERAFDDEIGQTQETEDPEANGVGEQEEAMEAEGNSEEDEG